MYNPRIPSNMGLKLRRLPKIMRMYHRHMMTNPRPYHINLPLSLSQELRGLPISRTIRQCNLLSMRLYQLYLPR